MSEEVSHLINDSSNSTNATECGYSEGPVSLQRFIIIFVCSIIASVGVLCNLILLAVFRRSLPSSVFLAGLSLLDALLCLTYVLLFGVDASCNHLQVEFLFRLYHDYLRIIFFLCRVVQFAMPYMLILATLERFTWTAGDQMRRFLQVFFSDKGRQITALAIIFVSLAFRTIVYFSFEIVEFPDCEDLFSSISPVPHEFVGDPIYEIYEVQIVTSLQTVIPFIVLCVLNAMIIIKMCGEKRDQGIINRMRAAAEEVRAEREAIQREREQVCTQHMVKKASIIANSSSLPEHYVLMEVTNGMVQESFNSKTNREKAIQLRNAVFTMLVIVLSYLVCNGLNLFLLYYEKFHPESLYLADSRISTNFYIALSDSVSISYMLSSAIRLFIYAKCNPKLRKELKQYLWGMDYVPTSEEDSMLLQPHFKLPLKFIFISLFIAAVTARPGTNDNYGQQFKTGRASTPTYGSANGKGFDYGSGSAGSHSIGSGANPSHSIGSGAVPSYGDSVLTKSAEITGTLMCGDQPEKDAIIRLYRNVSETIENLLAVVKTKEDGSFRIEGNTAGKGAAEAGIKGYRSFGFTIEDELYVSLGRIARKAFNIGKLNTQVIYPGEKRDLKYTNDQPLGAPI
ncbi:hypothetical protein PRIPAC_88069 [Pristionchus pacificus]|uniref:G_PROTEIN_RECEP_F1_2 domain-containing protein n=1 Tax=Pristionchus pacificus TaxID=54126 RepID=A0A2A6B6B5_PRIPA|nr:hypothetical protein PRIPAC_88069 [Pristionchus pacificus]|eukprot:PDM61393.1 hypothetical protein PRIPAC_50835 [Pristionchus pacificus]